MIGGRRRSGGGLWFVVLLAVSVALVAASSIPAVRSAQQATSRLLDPVREAVAAVGRAGSDLVEMLAEIDRLRQENVELRAALAGAEQRIAELGEAAADNAVLRDLIGLRHERDWALLPTRVTSIGTSGLTWDYGIDAGRNDGVRVGMPVVGAADGGGALLGIVIEAANERAVIRLVVDSRSRVVARDQRTDALGVVSGQPGGALVMTQVALTDEVAVGDTIVTAGLEIEGVAASAYPRGLLIGTVSALEVDANGLTQTVFVRPAMDPRDVAWLMVVLEVSEPA